MKTAIRKHLGDFIALVTLFVIALGVGGYIVANQDARGRIPLVEDEPFKLKAEFSDAQAVRPGQGQSVRVAGVEVGKITRVDLKDGIAVVTLDLDKKKAEKLDIRGDATALLRPRTGLKDMFVELDPGGRDDRKIGDGGTIPVQNTAPDVDPDEFLSAFDFDTRQYLQLLINGAGKGLKGNGDDLNATFKALEPLNRDLLRITSAVAERRRALRSLISNYGDVTNTLANKDAEIRRLVNESETVLQSFANQETNISAAVAKLPGTLNQTADTLGSVERFGRVLGPSLESLRPAFRQLAVANEEVRPFVREAEPIVRRQIRPFIQTARPYVRDLRGAAIDLSRATPDLVQSFYELNRFFNMLAHNPKGREGLTGDRATDNGRDEGYLFWLAWVANNTVSMFSTADAQGVLRRAMFGLSCSQIEEEVAGTPAAGPVIGLTNALEAPGICQNSAQSDNPNDQNLVPGIPPAHGPTESEKLDRKLAREAAAKKAKQGESPEPAGDVAAGEEER